MKHLILSFLFFSLSLSLFAQTKTIKVILTVDWEGRVLESVNTEAFERFRKEYPAIPLVQFLNAAYYTKNSVKNDVDKQKAITAQSKSLLLPIDMLGLHLHGWKSLFTACGVNFQKEPVYKNVSNYIATDIGKEVAMEYAYSAEELAKILNCSKDILGKQGFDASKIKSFRAGGWIFGPKFREALIKTGFTFDSSYTAPEFIINHEDEKNNPLLKDLLKDSTEEFKKRILQAATTIPMIKMMQELYPQATMMDQPFIFEKTTLKEYPDNASLADYVQTEDILFVFEKLLAKLKEEKDRQEIVMVSGFHQESAGRFLERVQAAIPQMEKAAKDAGVSLKFTTFEQ